MAVTANPYSKAILGLGQGYFNFGADTFKIALTTSGYTVAVDADEFITDITDEITGTGYTAGGLTLTGLVWGYTTQALLAADPALWTAATFPARTAVIYKDTGTPATSRLLSYVDFGADRSPAGVDFQVTFAAGVLVAARV